MPIINNSELPTFNLPVIESAANKSIAKRTKNKMLLECLNTNSLIPTKGAKTVARIYKDVNNQGGVCNGSGAFFIQSIKHTGAVVNQQGLCR